MVPLRKLFERVSARKFDEADARELIKLSYYFASTHPDVHIVLSTARQPDYHFQHVPKYNQREFHTMFRSMRHAAASIAATLNTKAGESALRFLSVSIVTSTAIISRSGASAADAMVVRTKNSAQGRQGNPSFCDAITPFVIAVLTIRNEQVALTTAYPALARPKKKPVPPPGSDMVELPGNAPFLYACS